MPNAKVLSEKQAIVEALAERIKKAGSGILIDYKGGGMAKALENLPHTAGVITNLDGNGIKRSLASMRSELHRREAIFAETSKRYGIGNIDIYKYQRLYREGKVTLPDMAVWGRGVSSMATMERGPSVFPSVASSAR